MRFPAASPACNSGLYITRIKCLISQTKSRFFTRRLSVSSHAPATRESPSLVKVETYPSNSCFPQQQWPGNTREHTFIAYFAQVDYNLQPVPRKKRADPIVVCAERNETYIFTSWWRVKRVYEYDLSSDTDIHKKIHNNRWTRFGRVLLQSLW